MTVAKALTKRGHIKLGDAVFDVFVIDNGMRVCTQRTLVKALGGSGGKLATAIGKNTAGSLDLGDPVRFDMLDGIQANGWRVGEIGKLCSQIIELQMAGVLPPERIDLARAANRLNGALAGIALEALVDEACDYQSVREGDFLRRRLQFALREEADEWNRLWKKSTVKALCTVYGKTYDGGRHPQWLASIMDKIHRWALGREVAASMKERNPEPHFKSNHHQLLTEPVRKKFETDLLVIESLAKVSRRNPPAFWRRVADYLGRDETGQLVLVDE